MAVLTLFSTVPTHCTLHKHILCVVCVHQRENILLIYTEGSHHRRLSIHVGRPWSPGQSTVWGTHTHIHTHTGHYTHLPDERVRQRERRKKKDWVVCFLSRPCNYKPQSLVMDCYYHQGRATHHRQGHHGAGWRTGWRGGDSLEFGHKLQAVVKRRNECVLT